VNNGGGTINANGLPVISNNVTLTINGNNATISRAGAAPRFRILQIAGGASLTLNDLTLSGGFTSDGLNMGAGEPGGSGGGVLSSGTLNVNRCIIANNHTGDGIGVAFPEVPVRASTAPEL